MFCLTRSHWELKQHCELELAAQGTLCVDAKRVSDGQEGGAASQKETETELGRLHPPGKRERPSLCSGGRRKACPSSLQLRVKMQDSQAKSLKREVHIFSFIYPGD